MELTLKPLTRTYGLNPNEWGKNEQSLGDLWGYDKRGNFCVIRVPEGKEKGVGAEKVFKEIMAEKILNVAKDINLQI